MPGVDCWLIAMQYDVAVAGLGGIGSAILAHCAARGASTIGFEQFTRGHAFGASSGRSRLIRKAYFEDPAYVPLLLRAYDLWRDLETQAGEELLHISGLLSVGAEDSTIIAGSRNAAGAFDLPIEVLSRRQIKTRFPTLALLDHEMGIFEPDGGVLRPERAVLAQLRVAETHGAKVHFETECRSWEQNGNGVELLLGDGTRQTARILILALGPWFAETLASVGVPLRIQRNVQAWFEPKIDAYHSARFPAFLLDRSGLPAPLYGVPDFGDGIKAAFHGLGAETNPDQLEREVDLERDIEPIVRGLRDWMPGAVGILKEAKACMYALTPDQHFILDRHPEHQNIILCGGFSGHGFKFAPVIGEIGAELALDGGSCYPIEFLGLKRFVTKRTAC
ncbi:MAG TPA: N-methyl-L-tryptophan oxidase [Chthoniobacterales bacterium]|nr:N-methyl-L-tryptophan oxidase [Chthoniobacterales bacterium]